MNLYIIMFSEILSDHRSRIVHLNRIVTIIEKLWVCLNYSNWIINFYFKTEIN